MGSPSGDTLMMFEVLHRALVSLRGFLCAEGTKIAPATRFRILLSRVEAILAGF